MGFQDEWNRSLVLGLGFDGVMENSNRSDHQQPSRSPRIETLDTCLTLSLASNKIEMNMASDDVPVVRQSSSQSTVTSFTNPNFNITSIKRERDAGLEDFELERVSSRASDDDDDGSGRKKLRLTKEQSALLEDNFKEHSTLNPKQKHALAMQLHLRPRQVEVWFQNRRARTKLKQTEVDCDYLKRCCEALRDENRRLHKELLELKALKLASSPLYMPLPAATLTMCPSCQLIGVGSSNTTRVPFAMPPKSHSLYNPFSNLPRAC